MKKNKKLSRCLSKALCIALSLSMFQSASAISLTYTPSSSYQQSTFYQKVSSLPFTSNQRNAIVSVAKSQINYTEGNKSSQLGGTSNGSGNYTEYGRWYGLQDMWCAMFVSWCAEQAGVSTSVIPKHSFTPSGLQFFIDNHRAYTRAQVANGEYTPQPGDLVYFKSNRNNNKTNHVGIVTGYNSDSRTIHTIEGNTTSGGNSTNGGSVYAKSYSINDTFIVYICSPKYTSDSSSAPAAPAPSASSYFPRCSSSCTTITQGLNNIGANSSYSYRKTIAAANGISGYSGTAAQNNKMLSMLKNGTLKKPGSSSSGSGSSSSSSCFPRCSSSCTTITQGLNNIGANSSYSYRKTIAAANGISGYSGTAAQNNKMLSMLKSGVLLKP